MKKVVSLLLVLMMIVSTTFVTASAAYENTHSNTGNQRVDIIEVAKTQIGNTNGLKYRSDGASWCAAFIVWCARQADVGSSIIKNTGWATADDLGITYYGRNADRTNSITYTPQSGDVIIFDWSSNGYCYKSPASSYGDHVGLVEYVSNGYVHTIEGNSGSPGSVKRKSYSLSSSEIKGYGVPNYKNTEPERHSVITTWAAPVGQESPILSEGLVNTQYQFWYRMLDKNTGDLYNSYTNTNYSATIYVYNPDGSVLFSNNYGRSDNNWIRCTPTKVGTYKITVKVTGDIETGYTREFKVTSDGKVVMSPSTLDLNLANKPSGKVNISLSGNWPDDAVYEITKSNNNIQYTQNGSVLTVTGVKTGSTDLKIKIYAKDSGTALSEFTTKVNVNTNTLKVYFNANGGSISSDTYKLSSNLIYNKSDSSQYYQKWTYNNTKENGLVNASTFGIYKTGYTFNGWGTKASGGTVFDQGDNTLKPTDINANIKNGDCSTTLYAQWKANVLTINYNANGGSINSEKYKLSSNVLYYISNNSKVNDLWEYNNAHENGLYNPGTFGIYKTGYSFNGWGTKSNGGTIFDQNDASLKPTSINSNIKTGNCSTTLYAQWVANGYKIAFNGNGATSGSMSNLSMTYGTAKNLTANSFVKTGCTFNGWNTKADGSGTAYANKVSVKNLTSAKGGTITLYAQWKANSYTIAFNGNGATSGSMSNLAMTYGTAKNLTANAFSKTGYTFNGWNTKADGSGTAYANKVSVKNLTSAKGGTITLYAQWKANSYTIAFNGNGATSGSMSNLAMTYGTAKNLTANAFSKTGYTFNGWNTKADGSGTAYANKVSVKNLTSAKGGTVTLYAQWKANPVTSYTVSYNANGGSVSPSSASVTAGNSVTLPTPTKSYTITYNVNGGNNAPSSQSVSVGCKGWTTSSSSSSAAYSCGASYKPTANVTLYAVWNSSANKTLSTTTPTRNGYTFLGWSTSSSATSSTWKKGETITLMGNTTLYAVWQKIETPVPTPDPVPEVVYKTVALNYKDVYQINIDEFDAVEFVAEDDSVLTVDSDGTVRTHSTGSADVYVYDSNSDVRMVYTFEVDYAWWQWIIIIVLFGWIWY